MISYSNLQSPSSLIGLAQGFKELAFKGNTPTHLHEIQKQIELIKERILINCSEKTDPEISKTPLNFIHRRDLVNFHKKDEDGFVMPAQNTDQLIKLIEEIEHCQNLLASAQLKSTQAYHGIALSIFLNQQSDKESCVKKFTNKSKTNNISLRALDWLTHTLREKGDFLIWQSLNSSNILEKDSFIFSFHAGKMIKNFRFMRDIQQGFWFTQNEQKGTLQELLDVMAKDYQPLRAIAPLKN